MSSTATAGRTGGSGMSASAGMSGGAGTGASGMSAGTSGTGAAGTGTAGAGGSGSMHTDLGKGDGKDVVTIGDSWMNLIVTGIEQSLDAASGQMYRHYAVPGTLVLNEQIPGQFKSAVAANPDIKTVVMTGGGNDILTSSCADTACNSIVDQVSDRLTQLLMEMGTGGVQDVMLIGYTYPSDMTKHAALDHSRMLSAKICTSDTKPRCHYLDSTMLNLTLQDGIHPDAAGMDLIGKTVWQMMQDDGVRR